MLCSSLKFLAVIAAIIPRLNGYSQGLTNNVKVVKKEKNLVVPKGGYDSPGRTYHEKKVVEIEAVPKVGYGSPYEGGAYAAKKVVKVDVAKGGYGSYGDGYSGKKVVSKSYETYEKSVPYNKGYAAPSSYGAHYTGTHGGKKYVEETYYGLNSNHNSRGYIGGTHSGKKYIEKGYNGLNSKHGSHGFVAIGHNGLDAHTSNYGYSKNYNSYGNHGYHSNDVCTYQHVDLYSGETCGWVDAVQLMVNQLQTFGRYWYNYMFLSTVHTPKGYTDMCTYFKQMHCELKKAFPGYKSRECWYSDGTTYYDMNEKVNKHLIDFSAALINTMSSYYGGGYCNLW